MPELIYIDADHHYEAVLRDVRACLKAFPKALVVGDDYGNYKDVENAVLEVGWGDRARRVATRMSWWRLLSRRLTGTSQSRVVVVVVVVTKPVSGAARATECGVASLATTRELSYCVEDERTSERTK